MNLYIDQMRAILSLPDDGGEPPLGRRGKSRKTEMTVRNIPAFARAFDLIVAVAFVSLSLVLAGATVIA
jgi:hypothetical protein